MQFNSINYIYIVVQLPPHLSTELFHLPKWKLCLHQTALHLCLPEPTVATTLFSVSMNVTTLGASDECNNTVFGLL